MRDQPTPEQTPERIAARIDEQIGAMEQASKLHPHDWTVLRRQVDALTATLAHLTQRKAELEALALSQERVRALWERKATERSEQAERAEQAEATLARVKALDVAAIHTSLVEARNALMKAVRVNGYPSKQDECDRAFAELDIQITKAVSAVAALVDPPVSPKEPKMDKRARGLYKKFVVTRTDGQSEPGQKHDGCNYFVLDLTHDPHAIPALRAYADSCRADYPLLAHDLDSLADGNPYMPTRTEIPVDPPVSAPVSDVQR